MTEIKLSRKERRFRVSHRNHVRQVILFVNKEGILEKKVVFHVKIQNFPRMYSNMSKIK